MVKIDLCSQHFYYKSEENKTILDISRFHGLCYSTKGEIDSISVGLFSENSQPSETELELRGGSMACGESAYNQCLVYGPAVTAIPIVISFTDLLALLGTERVDAIWELTP